MFGFGKKKKGAGDEAAFWEWFENAAPGLAADYDAFVNGKKGPDALIAPVAKRLSAYHDGLVHEIGRDEAGLYDLVISADGLKGNVEAVAALTKAAPEIDGWKVTAFRPRKTTGDTLLEMGGQEFSEKDVLYRLGDCEEGRCDIEIRFRAKFSAPDEALIEPAFIIMDSVIGEYDVMTKIGEISVSVLSDGDNEQDFKSISDLAAEIDARFPEQMN